MPKCIRVMAICIFSGLTGAPMPAQNIGFQEVISFQVPNISEVTDYCFDDIDYDSMPEVLVLCADTLVLYSETGDSVLFSIVLDSALYHKIALGDVNRDSVVDICVAHVYSISGWASDGTIDSAYAIEVFDGAASFASTAKIYFPNFHGDLFQEYHLWMGMASFGCMDVNSDGFDNLFLSYANYLQDRNPSPHYWSSDYPGRVHIFYSFPDSLCYHGYFLLLNPQRTYGPSGNFLTGQLYYRHDGGDPYADVYTTHVSFVLFNQSATAYYNLLAEIPQKKEETSQIRYDQNIFDPVCIGDLDIHVPGLEIVGLLRYSGGYAKSTSQGSYSRLMQMYHRYSQDSISLMWQQNSERDYTRFFYHPDYAGTFFGYIDGTLYQIDGQTGTEILITNPLPSRSFRWQFPFDDSVPYLVTANDNSITIFSVENFTSIDDDNVSLLPRELKMGQPYPNPFNASQTIPVSVKSNTHLTVTVYDLLGREITRLFDGVARDRKLKLTWRAENQPSGIYFIRASSDRETAVISSILLK